MKKRRGNRVYTFRSEGVRLSALTLPTYWVVIANGEQMRYDYSVEPETWLRYWQKLKDVDGVLTMLRAMPQIK